MKPRRLLIENVHSFLGRHEIDFSQIACAVLSGPNGVGKSTLAIDAPLYVLFNETRGRSDSIVSEGEQLGRVELEFGIDGKVYVIGRQRSTKGAGKTTTFFHMLTPDGPIVLDGKGEAETQKRIEQVTHLTADLLRATAVSAQGDADAFARAKATERKGWLGHVVGTEYFDELLEATRDIQKGVQAERDGKATALETAQATAATIPSIEEQLAAIGLEVTDLERQRDEAAKVGDALAAERERTVKAQAEDEAARKELMDLRSRQTSLAVDEIPAKAKLDELEFTIAAAGDLLMDIRAAEDAQKQATVFETRQKERDRLKSEATILVEKIKGWKASHGERIQALETEIATVKRDHARDLNALREDISRMEKLAERLSNMPCVIQDSPMSETCPAIADGIAAKAVLPAKRRDLATLEKQTPWTEQESRWDALRAATPWKADADANARLKTAYDAIEYDADAHAEAKAKAAQLPDLQKILAGMEAARDQIPDAKAALEKLQAELKQIGDRVTALEAELGQMTDWPAQLTRINTERAAALEEQARLGRALDVARQNQGGLTERLEAANKAAEQVKALETEIADLDRRIRTLKILGNSHDGAFSKSGIPALLIAQAVPELEAAANDVLDTLSDGRMALELRTQRENKDGGIAEALDIVCFVDGSERLREALSGGEGTRFDLALRAGLAKMLAERAGARCEFLVLDEPPGLDERGQDELIHCLGKLSAHFATILLVTHINRLKESLPVRLQVSRDAEGSSNVEVIYQ